MDKFDLGAKRIFDIVSSSLGLIILLPVFVIISIAIKMDSEGEVFFRQIRVGRNGKPFKIYKFRTMMIFAEKFGKQITVGADKRITDIGKTLRKYKMDELPQLINVVLGDMSLVGPRPEVPKYVAEYSKEAAKIVLSVRPGITDQASIEYKSENDLLAKSSNPEKTYIEEILPIKINYYIDYVQTRSFFGDVRIIFKTLFAILGI